MSQTSDKSNRKHRLATMILLCVALLGVIVVLVQTRFGPGTTGDSVNYLMGTQNLLSGNGYSRTSGGGEIRPITMRPPFYSIALTTTGWINIDILDGVRIFQAILFGVNIFLVGFLILSYTQSLGASLIGAAFILLAETIVLHHGWVLTEGLFCLLMLLTFFALARYFDGRKTSLILLAGVAVGLAMVTRYLGVSLLLTGAVSILILSRSSWKQRLMDCVLFCFISLLPVGIWLIRNMRIAGTMVNRRVKYHPMPVELIRAYRAEISFWFVPARLGFPHGLRKAIMLLLAIPGPLIFFALEIRERWIRNVERQRPFWALPWILAVFIVSYFVSLYLSLTIVDAVIDFNVVSRYLVPVYVSAIALSVIIFFRLIWQEWAWKVPRAIILLVAIILLFLYGQNTLEMLKDPIPSMGYTGHRENNPEVVARLNAISKAAPIISNDPEMVFIFVNRPAYMIPIQFDYNAKMEREDFDQQLEATRRRLQQGGVLVLFAPMTDADFEVARLLDAVLFDSYVGSLIYGYP